MAEKYTYADVIIDPNDPRVEIGAEYYYCDNPSTCLERANKKDVAHLAVLEKVYPDAIGHFFIDDAYSICIIRKKEPVKRYVPFDLSDAAVREQLWGKRIVINAAYMVGNENIFREIHSTITGFTCCQDGEPKDDWTIDAGDYSLTAEEALEKAHFYDESPCGKLVEEE